MRARKGYTCPHCQGTGQVPYVCECCSRALHDEYAMCETCAAQGCYENPNDSWRFSHVQKMNYQVFMMKHPKAFDRTGTR